MKTSIKRIAALLIGLSLIFTSAFAAGYSSENSRYTKADIIQKIVKLVLSRGLVSQNTEEAVDSSSAGTVYFSADAFCLGMDYIVYPMAMEFQPGDNAAMIAMRALDTMGLRCENSGSVEDGFYLRRIWGIDAAPNTEVELEQWLAGAVTYYRPEEWQNGSLGEFDFTDMSGWVYFVNGEMPMASMSDYEISDGDVISLRFSLAGGMDIGGPSYDEDIKPYVEGVNRDAAVKAIADGKLDYMSCAEILKKASASQEEIDELVKGL